MVTLLLIYDYFPTSGLTEVLPQRVLFWFLIGTVVMIALVKTTANATEKSSFQWQLFILIYAFLLIACLGWAGGESTVGISFKDPLFWMVSFIALVQLGFQWKRMRREKWQNEEVNGLD